MIPINIGDHSGSERGILFNRIPQNLLPMVRWARTHAFNVARENPAANAYFRSLPRSASLRQLLDDRTIWINFDPATRSYEHTHHNKNQWLGGGAFAFAFANRWMVLSTIIHELAHINGAGGGATGLMCGIWSQACHAAERAVLECGLGHRSELRTGIDDPSTPYDPNIVG